MEGNVTIIETKNVTKKIKDHTVIDNISFQFESGLIYGLQGINGSGKTMLMRLISGLIYPTSGTISINGKILGSEIDFPPSLGLLLENPAFLDSYSGYQNLQILSDIQKKIDTERINEVLREVGLENSKEKKYKKYSLGMKQRLGIAAAYMENPEIVIMDEPTNSLDDSGIAMLKDILVEQKRRNALVILSCHDLSILTELSDEILRLENGRIVEHIK